VKKGMDASKRQRIKSVATKTKKTSQSSFSSNPKESLKHFQKHIPFLLNHWSLSKAAKLRVP